MDPKVRGPAARRGRRWRTSFVLDGSLLPRHGADDLPLIRRARVTTITGRRAGSVQRRARRTFRRRASRKLDVAPRFALTTRSTRHGSLSLPARPGGLVTGGSEAHRQGHRAGAGKEGADVAISRAPQGSRRMLWPPRLCKVTGRMIVAITADLRQDADAKNFIEQAHKALGRADIMINNAGSRLRRRIEHLDEDIKKGSATRN